jgi:hypothetical protein
VLDTAMLSALLGLFFFNIPYGVLPIKLRALTISLVFLDTTTIRLDKRKAVDD